MFTHVLFPVILGNIYPPFSSAGVHWPNLNVDSNHLNSSLGPKDKAEIGFLIQFLFHSWLLHKDSRDPACIKQKEVVIPIADDLDSNSYDTDNVFVFSSFLHFSAFIPLRLFSVDLWESRGFCFHFLFWIRCIFDTSVAQTKGYFRSGLYNHLIRCQSLLLENLKKEKISPACAVSGFVDPLGPEPKSKPYFKAIWHAESTSGFPQDLEMNFWEILLALDALWFELWKPSKPSNFQD